MMRNITSLAVGALVSVSAEAVPRNSSQERDWKTLAPVAGGPRQEHAVAALANDIYIIGGIELDQAGDIFTTNKVEA